MTDLQTLFAQSSAHHSHLCPRQVLGVRMGLAGAAQVGITLPRNDKALLVIAESDGCFADGLSVAAGVSVGHRTLRVEDYGKIAATFVNLKTESVVRLAPRSDVRVRVVGYAHDETRPYFAQLMGYQHMPDEELFLAVRVHLTTPLRQIISRAGVRVNCSVCDEEIINEREIMMDGKPYCKTCAGVGYYVRESD